MINFLREFNLQEKSFNYDLFLKWKYVQRLFTYCNF